MRPSTEGFSPRIKKIAIRSAFYRQGPLWYSGTMRALGSEWSPSARVRILSTVRVQVGLPHSGQRFPSGWALR
ncbi:hypothetical protein E2C01_044060 [Portunus trituberculatus]|uniref:Uncharacterized protein n=1 Tax=Portunus trituberculatus TaxID=210409 RepID=A0A5B7FXC9_PORTR|nr:hypothetical protein [Portunus trituberculatus]